ncbi:MAG: hypothetical protein JKY32_09885 [Rhizobiales bacterium]|nr:hypothetical protein [Hyphomicrobiales bacterium]
MLNILPKRLVKMGVIMVIGAGLGACAHFQQPPTEFAEPEGMREGPGIFSGDHGTIVLKY